MSIRYILLISSILALVAGPASALDVLLAGTTSNMDVQARLTGLGHVVTSSDPATWEGSFDYSVCDVVAFQFSSPNPADISNLVTAVDDGLVGVVFFRGHGTEATAIALGMITGMNIWWQTPTDLNVIDNTHPITEGLYLGVHNLGYMYMSYVEAVDVANTATLATGPDGPALVVHNTRNVVITPYYAHAVDHGLENQTGLDITERSLQWAGDPIQTSVETSSWSAIKATYRK
jgi:hypothetical protein